jgi:mRNA-degrading endonuclease toxin of MazEF toxin-antitoxin module
MIYRRGDVVLLELPFSDRTGKKKRPGLVIANETYLSATSAWADWIRKSYPESTDL